VQTALYESGLPSTSKHATRKEYAAAFRVVFSEFCSNPSLFLRRSYAIFRISLARIGTEFATMGERIDPGPAFQFQDGYYQPNAYTNARVEGIKTLLATRRWVGNWDARIFLMGFDAGAKYSIAAQGQHLSSPSTHHSQQCQAP
jgi:hypothetical protein